jgi:hypothetical protein
MRRRSSLRTTVVGLAIMAMVLTAPGPAFAGGWWSYLGLQGRHVGPGEKVIARSEVLFRSTDEAARAAASTTERYYIYLIPDLDWAMVDRAMMEADPGDWWTAPRRAIRLGAVRIRGVDGNLARLRASFEIPEVTPGTYALMACDEGCVRPLADLVPSEIIVAADALTAATARKLEHLSSRMGEVRRGLVRDVRRVEHAASEATERANTLMDRVSAMERGVARLLGAPTSQPAPSSAPFAIGWLVAGFVLGAWATAAFRRRRAARTDGQPPPPWVPDRATASAPDRAAIPMAWEGERPLASPNVRPAANESPAPYASRVGPGTGVAR